MKKILALALCVILTIIVFADTTIKDVHNYDYAGNRIPNVITATNQQSWQVLDTTTSSGYEPNDLAASERTYATVSAAAEGGDEEISIILLPETWNRLRLRCIGITNNNSVIYEIYLGTKASETDCELSYAGQLSFTIGQQASTTSTYEMADTLDITESDWICPWSDSSPASDRVAEAMIDLMGADLMVIVPTTAACDCKLLGKGY